MKKIRLSNVLEEKKEFVDEEMIHDSEFRNLSILSICWNIKIDGCKFTNCKFTHLDLEQLEWIDVIFDHCDLDDSEWVNTNLKGIDFSTSSISNILISNDLLKGVIVNESQALEFVRILGLIVKSDF